MERLGVGIGIHEDHRPPRVDAAGDQREIVVAQRAEPLARRHLPEPPLQVPGPAVEGATDLGQPLAMPVAELAAPVQAGVLERPQLAVGAANDQHRDRADLVDEHVAGVLDVVDRAGELPGRRPHLLGLDRGPGRIGVARRIDLHRRRDPCRPRRSSPRLAHRRSGQGRSSRSRRSRPAVPWPSRRRAGDRRSPSWVRRSTGRSSSRWYWSSTSTTASALPT